MFIMKTSGCIYMRGLFESNQNVRVYKYIYIYIYIFVSLFVGMYDSNFESK